MVELREQDPARLIGRMRQLLNDRGFSDNVQKAWLFWARQFIEFHQAQGQTQPTAPDVRAFLGDCARQRQLTAAGRRQVLRAVRCLLEDVLGLQLDGLRELEGELLRDAGPILLSPTQVQELLSTLEGSDWLLASLVYGAGLRLMETVRLRIRDIATDRILVRAPNGRLGRETVL
ncbi:MAG: phage integrase N-terminal SAM-like domain-containing protein, partial [Wenzhouxiangella sp.]|nr:phage integrase N-terminal SAM-like domain-containing protein [Wenzhouxiangella sp.]